MIAGDMEPERKISGLTSNNSAATVAAMQISPATAPRLSATSRALWAADDGALGVVTAFSDIAASHRRGR
ncbi:hypothetical protein GS500_20460 [Rhodococcus hoagii]|nr:hypothetical protein [Prescottella equi]